MKYLKSDFEKEVRSIGERYILEKAVRRAVNHPVIRFDRKKKLYYVKPNELWFGLMSHQHKVVTEIELRVKAMNRENHGKKKPGMIARWDFLVSRGQLCLF